MTTAIAGKEEEIARLLAEGNTPVDLIKRGFRRATVYKVNRRVQTGGTPQETRPFQRRTAPLRTILRSWS